MHLGWLQYLYGSIFHLLCFNILPGEALQNLTTIGVFIKTFQNNNRTKHKYLTRLDKLTMFQPKKGYPRLRGRAADIAGLHEAMLALWCNYMVPGDLQHRQKRLCLQLKRKIADILETNSPTYGHTAVPAIAAQQLLEAGLNMAQLHGQLSEYYQGIGLQVFNLTSKTHFSCTHCSSAGLFTLFLYGATRAKAQGFKLFGSLAFLGRNAGRLQRKLPTTKGL